jgi:hypothetical protein
MVYIWYKLGIYTGFLYRYMYTALQSVPSPSPGNSTIGQNFWTIVQSESLAFTIVSVVNKSLLNASTSRHVK